MTDTITREADQPAGTDRLTTVGAPVPDGGPAPDGAAAPDRDPEAGLATAEYAIATIAAVGFAGLLLLVLQSDTVRGMLEALIGQALTV